jgi:hypothetical protein
MRIVRDEDGFRTLYSEWLHKSVCSCVHNAGLYGVSAPRHDHICMDEGREIDNPDEQKGRIER